MKLKIKSFVLTNKFILRSSIALVIIILAIISALIIFNVVKNNDIRRIDTEIESVYTSFENTADSNEKYEIFADFIADSESYSKYKENEKNYQNEVSEMKNYFVVSYENLIKENSIVISDKTTKKELSTAISNLNEVKKTINSNKVIQIEDFISEIDSKIENYETKIAEIEVAEEVAKKAEEERLKKKAEEKAKKEAEASEEIKKSNNSNTNSSTDKGDSSENKTNNGSNSNSSEFDSSGMKHTWSIDLNTGEKIEGTDQYLDEKTGNVYDASGNLLFNMNDWCDVSFR